MPIYEYECESCGEVVESWQRFSDPPLDKCEKCGGKMHKLVSRSSFHLKGTGWYVTDYAGKRGGSTSSAGPNDKKTSKVSEKKDSSAKIES